MRWFSEFLDEDAVPACPDCGSDLLKHATISFGQSLDATVLNRAATAQSPRRRLPGDGVVTGRGTGGESPSTGPPERSRT